jgi:HAE1 family hydrophobic/amphiphilic exporter-1
LIPSVAIPLSIVGTFGCHVHARFQFEQPVAHGSYLERRIHRRRCHRCPENVVRHVERGERTLDAALSGSKEIAFTVMSMTVSLAAVFLPVLFMGGILGRLLNEFAVTIAVAILVSGMVSLTLTPMLGSRFLRAHGSESRGMFYRLSERFFDGMLSVYERTLKVALRHGVVMILIVPLTIVADRLASCTIAERIYPTGRHGTNHGHH